MDGLECGVLVEEFLKFALLSGGELGRTLAHGGETATMVFELWRHRSGQCHEVMVDDAHDVKTIGHDSGVRKESSDHIAVRARKVDTDHLHFVASTQG